MPMQTLSALDAIDLVAEYIAHGLAIPMTLKHALDVETLEALNEVEDRIDRHSHTTDTDECNVTGVHPPADDVLFA